MISLKTQSELLALHTTHHRHTTTMAEPLFRGIEKKDSGPVRPKDRTAAIRDLVVDQSTGTVAQYVRAQEARIAELLPRLDMYTQLEALVEERWGEESGLEKLLEATRPSFHASGVEEAEERHKGKHCC